MMEYRMVRRALKPPATSTMSAHGGRKGQEVQPFYSQPPPHRVTGTLASSSCSCWPLPAMSWSTYTHWTHQHLLLKDRNVTYCSNNLLWWGNFCFPACFIFKLAFWWGGLEEIGNIHHFWFHKFAGTNSWCLRHRARKHQDNTKLQDNIFLALSPCSLLFPTKHCSLLSQLEAPWKAFYASQLEDVLKSFFLPCRESTLGISLERRGADKWGRNSSAALPWLTKKKSFPLSSRDPFLIPSWWMNGSPFFLEKEEKARHCTSTLVQIVNLANAVTALLPISAAIYAGPKNRSQIQNIFSNFSGKR